MWSGSRAARQNSAGSTICSGAPASRAASPARSSAGATGRPTIPSAPPRRSAVGCPGASRMSPETRRLSFYLAAVGAAAALFLLAPGIDLWASGLFYRPGEGFFLADLGVVRALYRAVPWIVAAQVFGI